MIVSDLMKLSVKYVVIILQGLSPALNATNTQT